MALSVAVGCLKIFPQGIQDHVSGNRIEHTVDILYGQYATRSR